MANIGEQVDILKFLPNHLIGTTTGLFLKAIQDYVNQMYEYKKDPTSSKCSISESQYKERVSLLGKIKGLADLHDAKQVDHEFIGRIADLLGFDFGISMSEMMDMISVLSVPEGTSVPLDIETGTMVDVLPIPASACGVADPADKATEFMRHILVELPYWFQIKGTDKLAKIFFWCFGLMMKWEYGYTRNYSNKNSDWVYTENKNDTNLVESGMIPTPHVRASFSLDESFADSYALVSWLNSQGLSRVVTTLTSIKPINAVIEDVVFSFDFNEAGRSLKGLAVNMSLGIDNYHRFKDWNSSDNIWDSGVGAVDPISFSLKKVPVGYTFRDQQIGEILEGAYNTSVSGSVNASGANTSDVVFTFSVPDSYYAQFGVPDMIGPVVVGKWVIVSTTEGTSGVATSSDGLTWSASVTPYGNWGNGSATYANGLWVITNLIAGTSGVATSTDGITWTLRTTPSGNFGYCSAVYANGMWVIANYYNSTSGIATSTDGITWTPRTTPRGCWGYCSPTYANGLWVITNLFAGTSGVATSTDGVTWTQRTTPSGSWGMSSPTYANGLWVITNNNDSTSGVATSTDGITWTPRTTPSGNWGYCSATYANGLWVITNLIAGTSGVATSTDGVTWTQRTTPSGSWGKSSAVYANGMWVIVNSKNGSFYSGVATSTDGMTWTQRTTPYGIWGNGSASYSDGVWVIVNSMVCPYGVATSSDGITWEIRSTPNGYWGADSATYA